LICGALGCVVACMVFFAVLAMELLAGARGYAQGEALWSKGQKDAVLALCRYAHSRSNSDYQQYLDAIRVPAACHDIRLQLDRPQYDRLALTRSFLEVGMYLEDRDRMIWLYRHFRGEPHIGKAISLWAEADREIAALQQDAERLHRQATTAAVDETSIERTLSEIYRINARVTPVEARFSQSVADASRWLHRLLVTAFYLIATFLVLAGSAVCFWLVRRVTDSEHRYRQLSGQLRVARDSALEASRAKSEFLANISHEIRTPLNGILGFTGLMAESGLTGIQREHNEAVRASADHLRVVIDDVLDFSRAEADRLELELSDFSVRKCVEAALGSMQSVAAEKGLATSFQVGDDVPDWVRGDPQRLRQILLNLLGNAVKFTANGSVAVRVSLASEGCATAAGSDGATALRQIQFSVSDTGPGVPESQWELIFQPFRQADGSVTRRFGGTGLGLAISQKLVARMGGRIWLESSAAEGSTFFFTAPLQPGQPPAGGDKTTVAAGGQSPADRPPCQPLSILVAEDNVINQHLIRALLGTRGHRVTLVGSGVTALAAWRHDHFDCILMDIQMPEMDGYEATRRIRVHESGNGAHIPIIALTAHAMKGDREKCLQAGLDSYISKPIQTAALDAALAAIAAGPCFEHPMNVS
jgi:signal transduction histidine kinase/ActR/RegA family two-component response regulator